VPRPSDALGGRRPGDQRVCCFSRPDGPLRDEVAELSRPENLAALADLPGQWIDKVH
jgi:hypothetical protein